MEIQAHHARVGRERVLRVARVLQRVATDQPTHLLHEIERAVPDGEEIVVLGVPRDRRDVPALSALVVELPQRQQRTFPFPELIALIFPVLEILRDVVVGVLVDHALHHLDRAGHRYPRHHLRFLLLGHRHGLILLLWQRFARLLRLLRFLLPLLLLLHHILLDGDPQLVLHVGVVHLPLRGTRGELLRGWGFRRGLTLARGVIHRLRRSFGKVELIAKRLGVIRGFPRRLVCIRGRARLLLGTLGTLLATLGFLLG